MTIKNTEPNWLQKFASVARERIGQAIVPTAMRSLEREDPELDEGGPLVIGLLACMTVLLLGALLLRG